MTLFSGFSVDYNSHVRFSNERTSWGSTVLHTDSVSFIDFETLLGFLGSETQAYPISDPNYGGQQQH